MALKNSMRTYKHDMLTEMRERGELDTDVYGRIKSDMESIKMKDIIPREFPARAEDIKYPENALNIGSLLYKTTNMTYGTHKPNEMDMPSKLNPFLCLTFCR